MRNRGKQRTPLCETGVENSPLALHSARNRSGASGIQSAFAHTLLQTSPDGQASGGQRGFSPLHSLTRVPLDPVEAQCCNSPKLPP